MVQEPIELTFFHSGSCTASASVVDPEKGKGRQRFFAVWALLRHPEHGYILFDTGYTRRFYEATRKFPEKLYALFTPVQVTEEESALQQLTRKGIKAADIRYIIVSHFHADHIGGLKDFPEAKIICSRDALAEVLAKKGFSAVRKGLLNALIPEDIKARTVLIEESATKEEDPSGLTLYTLWGDERLKLAALPGHARGMIGLLIRTKEQTLLFAADAGWSLDTFRRQVLPASITRLFFDSWGDYGSTFKKLLLYQQQNPETKILFTHCPETMDHIACQHV